MNAIEILINYSKLETVQNLVDNIDLVTDIIKDDVYKIAKSKRIYFYDFDFTYGCSVEIIKEQLLKKHLQGIQRFFNFDNLENGLKWFISRILNNMRNITTNTNFKLFINLKISNFEYEVYEKTDDFEKIIQILDIKKLDKTRIKKGLYKVWQEARYDKDFDYIDFIELCEKYGFDVDDVVGSYSFNQIQYKKYQVGKLNYQLEIII
ncbi:hypothetical protein [Aliarcobacter cryaerophilus]|uniref:hypothetical protein n=1 Tax=Aliarcobacter cryaerophilus TaxID=28198 RepID=UPI0021B2F998|nr:hypothetical protein [Aliarcobacter cryaerophilus]MCT7507164.1 hypothetical protein [Aliarcobacter cryaerophilus]